MALTAQQNQFVYDVSGYFNDLAKLLSNLEILRNRYFSRTYSGITDPDLDEANLDITSADLSAAINMINELNNNFLANQPVTQGDWQGVMDRMSRL